MPKLVDLKELWNELVIQFGYVAFFALSFPAAPFWAMIISIIHVKLTFFTFATCSQRPVCVERDSIGIWKNIFFVYSMIALAINVAILMFTSDGIFRLVGFNRMFEHDMYNVAIILAIAENVIFVTKFIMSVAISDTPEWIENELATRKIRKTIYDERSKLAHFKMKEEKKMSLQNSAKDGIAGNANQSQNKKSMLKNSEYTNDRERNFKTEVSDLKNASNNPLNHNFASNNTNERNSEKEEI
jgi:hypothetical protein